MTLLGLVSSRSRRSDYRPGFVILGGSTEGQGGEQLFWFLYLTTSPSIASHYFEGLVQIIQWHPSSIRFTTSPARLRAALGHRTLGKVSHGFIFGIP
jgi:hypothetical protein